MALCLQLKPLNLVKTEGIVSFCFFHSFLLITAFLYIPMLFSIMKYSNLRSVQESKPQKYILWQTLTILIFKSTHIPFYYIIWHYGLPLSPYIYYFDALDTYIAPLAMQLSYLGCNKKNVETLLGCMSFRKLVSKETTRIEPTSIAQQANRISTM
ncbi:unnamed protein product [Caenorhabditis brenneri]